MVSLSLEPDPANIIDRRIDGSQNVITNLINLIYFNITHDKHVTTPV